jgi:hypothetical protein
MMSACSLFHSLLRHNLAHLIIAEINNPTSLIKDAPRELQKP